MSAFQKRVEYVARLNNSCCPNCSVLTFQEEVVSHSCREELAPGGGVPMHYIRILHNLTASSTRTGEVRTDGVELNPSYSM